MKSNGFQVKPTFEVDRCNNVLQSRDDALDISYDPLRIIGVMGSLRGFMSFRLGKSTLDGGDRSSVVMEGSRSGWTGEDKGRLCHGAIEMAVTDSLRR